MKRNVAPLLVIAFIVAAISTGVFYGIFAGRLRASAPELPQRSVVVAAHNLERGTVLKAEDLKLAEFRSKTALKGSFDAPQKLVGATVLDPLEENQPVTDERLSLKDGKDSGGPNGVPAGMRAVSIHVYESSGVLGLLRRGSKVDIQAVIERNSTVELSPVLQNVEVLSVEAQGEPAQPGHTSTPYITILAKPLDSDLVALADSGTHLRVALRNPLDDVTEPRKALAVPSLFRAQEAAPQRSGAAGKRAVSSLQPAGTAGGPGQGR